MAQESRLQEMSLARAGNRAASCLRAAKRIVPSAGLLAALAIVCLPRFSQAQTPATAWGYMAGSENANVNDNTGAPAVPGGRDGAATWTDQSGNLWLFGGWGDDSAGTVGLLNDLWEYTAGAWALKSAAATLTVPGVDLCNAGNYTSGSYLVGGRQYAATWVDDTSGNLWLFGGQGCGVASTAPGYLNDLWMYNVSSGKWTFEGGGQTTNQTGTYGQLYTSSPTFLPGTRSQAVAWTGADGNFWLFGGFGFDSTGNEGDLNDLWKFDPATLQWTWMSGGLVRLQVGSYGTLGQPRATNVAGSRGLAAGTVDGSGNLWLFGGDGCGTSCALPNALNDLWMFNPTTLEWTWEAGSQGNNQPGSADAMFVTAGSNHPGSRTESFLWADAANNLWLFGGAGLDTSGDGGILNDLWEFDTTTMEWTFMGGSPTALGAETPVYGTELTPATTNIPGGRYSYAAWNNLNGNFWLFGGYGYNATASGYLNDLWEAIPPTPTPAFSLAAGTYEGTQTLIISDAIPDAAIYFTTNGNTPAITLADAYTGPVTVTNTEYVQAIAIAGSQSQSLPRQAQYVIEPQTAITWEPPAAITYGTPLTSVQLDATTSIPGAFVYSPDAGTVLPAGTQTLSVTFTPTDPSTAGFQAATATVTLQVNPATPVITWATPASIAYGTALGATQLDAAATFDGNTVTGTYTYSPASGAVLTAGTHTLTVTFTPTGAGASNYTTATASVTIDVTQDAPAITWAEPAAITYGTALSETQLDTTAAYGGTAVPGTFVYSPAAGTVLPAGTQTLNVTFTPTDTMDYATVQGSTTLVINQAAPVVSWPTPAAITYGTALGATQLDATASVPGTFVYAPAAGAVLTAGTHTLNVTFTPTDTTDYATVQASTTLVVGQAMPVITWPTPAAIPYGTALSATQLDALASYNGASVAGAFVYSPTIGAVLTAGTQTLTVTFTPTDTTDFTTATGSVTINVTKDTPTITWATPAAITYGTPLSATQLDATAAYNAATVPGTFVYSPAAGSVLLVGTQTLSVTFTPTDATDYSRVTATTTIVVNQATPIISWPIPAAITYGTALGATQLDATASVPGTFVYSPAAGAVLTAGTHTLNVTFTPTDTTDYATVQASTTLVVGQATPVITWPTPAAIAYGTALGATQLDAAASYNGAAVAGSYTYAPAAGTVLTVGAHTLTVTFAPTDATDFTPATASVAINVTQNAPALTWAMPSAITYGTPLSATQLDATAAYGATTIPGTFVYSPAAGAVLPAGTQTLSVTFTPADASDYASVTDSTTIVVNQAMPIINWENPPAIDYGTALSSAQLNATASVPGTFVYLPAAGTVPAVGTQTLSVTFTPADTNDYATANAGVTITVLAPGFTISGSPTGQTVYAGYSTDFVITVAPVDGTFNNAVTLSVTGLPSGATATFSQPTLTPGSSSASAILTVSVPSSVTMNRHPASPFGGASRALAPLMALLLLLPFRKVRKTARRISLLLILALSLGAMLSLSACGSPATNTLQWQSEFVLTVTGTSGGSTQTAQLVLTVE